MVGFGIVLGRIQRLNSWEIFTETERVITDSLQITTSSKLVMYAIFFGLLGNLVYFIFRKRLARKLENYLSKLSSKY